MSIVNITIYQTLHLLKKARMAEVAWIIPKINPKEILSQMFYRTPCSILNAINLETRLLKDWEFYQIN